MLTLLVPLNPIWREHHFLPPVDQMEVLDSLFARLLRILLQCGLVKVHF